MNIKKKLVSCVLALAVAIAFMPTSAFAASKAKSTVYDQVYKTGSTVYCVGAKGIYKVKVKKGKLKSSKLIYRYNDDEVYYEDGHLFALKKKGSYIYFLNVSNGSSVKLWRVKTSGKNKKCLAEADTYVIKGSKIYYEDFDANKKRVMKLNGKSKKKTKAKVIMVSKTSNKAGYKMVHRIKKGHVQDFLKTPKGTYYLGKIKYSGWGE